MALLPFQGKIIVPVQWQGTTQKTTMNGAGYIHHGTVGIRPYRTIAMIQWALPKLDALALLNTLQATKMNGIFDYQCLVRGAIRVRLVGEYDYTEVRANKFSMVSASVEIV